MSSQREVTLVLLTSHEMNDSEWVTFCEEAFDRQAGLDVMVIDVSQEEV